MLVYRSRLLTRGEVWFDQEPESVPVDWIFHRQRSSPVPKCRWKFFYTRLIDLSKSPDELLADMNEESVRKITVAREKDQTRWERCDSEARGVMDEVEAMWNRFAVAQRSAPLDRSRLDTMIAAGALDVNVAKDSRGEVLAYHLNFVTSRRVQQLIAVARFLPTPNAAMRNRINRANCLGHWSSFLDFKARGIRFFDFGGWYPGTTDIRLLGMNAFKRGFGGQVVREYDCEQILTLKGWVVITAARILNQAGSSGIGQKLGSAKPRHAKSKDYQVSPAFR
jgi:hypothetical protein